MSLTKEERDFFDRSLRAVREKVDLYEEKSEEFSLLTPKEIFEYLDRFVIGQEKAKKILSVVAHNHYKRLLIWRDSGFEKKLDKTNCILLGPTGSGKTYLVKQLAEVLKVPCYVADANSLTAAGYVGKDAESIVEGLISASGDNYDAAATGIIFIDEFDKIAKRSAEGGRKKDVGGEAVQQALLKIIEGTVMDFEKTSGLTKVKFQLDTSNILVIVGGAFVGLEEIIEKRMKIKRDTGIGLIGQETENALKKEDVLQYAKNIDLEEFGFIPEILGRLPLIAPLKELTVEDLKNIMTKVENNPVSQYKELFTYSSKKLEFTDEAIEEIAILAKSLGTGARSLKTIMENALLDYMFDLDNAKITKDDIQELYTQMGVDPKAEANN